MSSSPGVRPIVPPDLERLGPNVIGATGGSGTRVIARIVRRAKMYIGSDGLNESEDALCIADFYDRWINVLVGEGESGLHSRSELQMLDDFRITLAQHLRGLGEPLRPWGWKEPRSIFLVPFLDRHLPGLRFLHVVRDGRDMALSSNQNQLRKHGSFVGLPRAELSPAAQSIALWASVNSEAARFGRKALGERYLRIRFEDLCREPAAVAADVLDFFKLEGDPQTLSDEVVPPSSLERWRALSPRVIAQLEQIAGPVLTKLGYELSTSPRDR